MLKQSPALVLEVRQLWGDQIIDIRHFADGEPVTIGTARDNAFHVFARSVGEQLTLARMEGGTTRVSVVSDSSNASRPQASEVWLGPLEQTRISFGSVAFTLRHVEPPGAAPAAAGSEADFTFVKICSLCILLFLALVSAMLLTPRNEESVSDELLQHPATYQRLLATAPKVRLNVSEGTRARGTEGKFGRPQAKQREAEPSRTRAPPFAGSKREEDQKMVGEVISSMFGGGVATEVMRPGGLGNGVNAGLGGLRSTGSLGDADGFSGLGSRGTGPGGGGAGVNLGGLGTKGLGPGAGPGLIDFGPHQKTSTTVIPGRRTVVGGLPKDVVEKVIKRHQSEIKYCYEQALTHAPGLFGKVAVEFVIDGTGSVVESNVIESSLNHAAAEACITDRIRRWRFPEPAGGGIVTVTFPWIFKAAGSGEDD